MNSVLTALPAVRSSQSLSLRIARIAGASMFVAAAAHLSVPLWFTPVPLTLGNLAVVLVGLALGPAEAFAALALYLGEGASGLPVFSPTGLGGVAQLIGPTGGFLFAYPFAAALAGLVARSLDGGLASDADSSVDRGPHSGVDASIASKREGRLPRFVTGALAATAATALVMTWGACWLSLLLHLNAVKAFDLGVLPFLPGEAVKLCAAAGLFATLQPRRL